jgi:hypothetical protein
VKHDGDEKQETPNGSNLSFRVLATGWVMLLFGVGGKGQKKLTLYAARNNRLPENRLEVALGGAHYYPNQIE